jgi:hypothetical protein
MAAATAALIIGTAIAAYGQVKSANDQADAERKNQKFFEEQAKFIQESGERVEGIYRRDVDQFVGNQISAFGRAGVDMSGSALLVIEDTRQREADEIAAIRKETASNVRLARMRGEGAAVNARNIQTSGYLAAGGSILGGAGRVAERLEK